jgi:cell division transport system permease protein
MEKYMRAFRTFLSFYIPLVAMLLSYSIYIALDHGIESYKKSIIDDYSIVVVSKSKLSIQKLQNTNIDLKRLIELPHNSIIRKFKNNLSKRSLDILDKKLPSFYKLYLNNFPSTNDLKNIKTKLLKNTNIVKVETFSKNHDKLSSILYTTEQIINILFSVIILFAILLLAKHIKIWFYENHEKISIMKLHGASNIYCAMPIINVALLSAIFSSITVVGFTYYVLNTFSFIIPIHFDFDFFKIIALSFIISIGTIIVVLFKHTFND